jgi:hypothetical protein
MRVRVCFHDNCFDGAASAALFTRFYRERVGADADFGYRGMAHQPGGGVVFPPGTFDGDENAVVDFRYSSDPALTWWFDHHVSAFPNPAEEAHFRADTSGRKFFDPQAKSCARFLARTCAERFGFDAGAVAELVHWAEIVDGALFESPAQAVALAEPALRLMTWMENNKDPALTLRFIGRLADARPLGEVAAEPWVADPLAPILAAHQHAVDIIARRIRRHGDVIAFDVTDDDIPTYNKFIPYFLHPDARFLVGLSRGPGRVKVFAGTNPWLKRPPVNIARICERYGGGGHPVVGAISLPESEVDRGRQIAAEIVDELTRAEPTK